MTPGRRTIRFASLDEIMPDVERLRQGHVTVGNWSLAQICGHLASVLRLTVDMPASTQCDPSVLFSPEQRTKVLDEGILPEGLPQPPALASVVVGPEEDEVQRLREALEYYRASPGPVASHRFLGPMTKQEWERLHRVHCAHHLSFAALRT